MRTPLFNVRSPLRFAVAFYIPLFYTLLLIPPKYTTIVDYVKLQ